MSWIRLDDQIAHHPKILKCPPTACWMYVACLGYAQRYLTNGLIPASCVPTLSHLERPSRAIRQLVTAGLLEKADGGWQIHHYLHFNDSKEDVTKHKDYLHQIRSEAGKNGAQRRWQTPKQTDSKLLDSKIAPSHPIPSPLSLKEQARVKEQDRAREPSGNGGGYRKTPIIPRNPHLSHAFCDPTLAYCVPSAVHHKLAGLLSPKHAGDHDRAADALLEWYATVAAKLVEGFVMGDAFRFWQGRFDETFASAEPRSQAGKLTTRMASAIKNIQREQDEQDAAKRLR